MRRLLLAAMMCWPASAVVVDRIAVVAAGEAIKDSDIAREIRVVSFLNGQPAQVSAKNRKDAAQRLIDQVLIARDIELGRYPSAAPEDVDKMLAQVRARYGAGYAKALEQHGITEREVREALAWQMTVLRYVEARFRGAGGTGAEQVSAYYKQHRGEFGQATLEQSRSKIETILRGEAVNKQFFDWLERMRKETTIRYLEDELR